MEFGRKDIEQAIAGAKLVLDKALKDLINANSYNDVEDISRICFNQLFAIRDMSRIKLDCE